MRLLNFILLLVLSINVSWAYIYDASLNTSSNKTIDCELQNQQYDGTSNLCNRCISFHNKNLQEKTQSGSFFAFEIGLVATNSVTQLSKSQLKGIRSLEKQIQKHQKKIDDFKANPTVRPGMENLPKDVIKRQQQARVKHLETEINTFKNNIDKIKSGGG